MEVAASEKGRRTEALVAQHFGLVLEHDREKNQLCGIDAYTRDGKTVQIKRDDTIAQTGNLYLELAKKPFINDDNRTAYKPLRGKPLGADAFCFVSGDIALLVPAQALWEAAVGKPLVRIRDTSVGVLVPLAEVAHIQIALTSIA